MSGATKRDQSELFRDLLPLLNSGRIVLPRNDRLQGQSLGLSVAQARLAATPSRIPSVATMTWRMPLPARRHSPNSADTNQHALGVGRRRRQRRRWQRVRLQAFINSGGRIRL